MIWDVFAGIGIVVVALVVSAILITLNPNL